MLYAERNQVRTVSNEVAALSLLQRKQYYAERVMRSALYETQESLFLTRAQAFDTTGLIATLHVNHFSTRLTTPFVVWQEM